MASNLRKTRPMQITTEDGERFQLPDPYLIDKFDILHFFLEDCVLEWKIATKPYEDEIAGFEGEDEIPIAFLRGFMNLQPKFLKCLFSYLYFFFSAEEAYLQVYSQLNRASHLAHLFIKHGKPPKKGPNFNKARLVRNNSITHMASKKTDPDTARTALSWQPLSVSRAKEAKWRIQNIEFCSLKLVKRTDDGVILKEVDLSLPPLEKIHEECLDYLEAYDATCLDYLMRLHEESGYTP